MVVLVALHVSAPYSSTDFTLELKMRILVCNDNTLELQMFLSGTDAPLAFPNPLFNIRICITLLVNNITQVREGLYLLNFIHFQCDWLHALCIYLEDLCLAAMYM